MDAALPGKPRRVRSASPADAAAVTRLVDAAYRHYIERIGRPPAPMLADYQRAIAEHTVWLIDIDGEPGAILVLLERGDHLLIENVAVHPSHQGIGLGGELLGFAEDCARAHGVDELRLYTNEKMTENLAYYPRRGYVETGRVTEDGFARVYFTKTVSQPPSPRVGPAG